MKTQVLLLAGCIALATVVRGQNDQAPANPAQAAPTNAAPAAQNTIPVAPTNAPVVIAAPDVIATAVLPAANMATNNPAAGDAMRAGATNELVPLIVIDDVPLLDAVKNLARQAGLNYLPDPRLTTVTNQPNVTMRLENVTAHDALMAVLETYN